MLDFLMWSGESWAMRSGEGMADYRVSFDGLVYQWLLGDFCGKVCMGCAQVSTYSREVLRVVNESELDVCLLTVCEGSNTLQCILH